MFLVVCDHSNSKLKDKQCKQKPLRKRYNTEIKILALILGYLNRALNYPAQLAVTAGLETVPCTSRFVGSRQPYRTATQLS